MPKHARYMLAWSPLRQTYELYESQSSEALAIASDDHAWLAWVDQISSFAFHGKNGVYTASKEQRQRGEGYWYAYARVAGKLVKRYLGRSMNLTISRLEKIAQELRLHRPDILVQKEEIETGGAETVQSLSSSIMQEKTAMPPDAGQHSHQPARRQRSNHADRKGRLQPGDFLTDPLLAVKLYVPRPRPHLVHRSRLIQRLEQSLERALTLISAPIGFGKSTLLSDWLASGRVGAIWLSLDPQDNEPARFLSYLFAALQTYDSQLATIRPVLQYTHRPPSMEGMLTLLINDLLMRKPASEEHVILVLDNYQFITGPSIHHGLSFLLEHLPPQMHLVIATREDPPLPLAQLRGRDDLLELRASDLRFTPEEANTFLTEVMGLPLSPEESALLQARTEGWITGLQLAAFSLQDREDLRSFITSFSGSHHYVVDYLLEEVLHRQSEDVQNFLLQTSILDRLCASLCDTVRGEGGSQSFLDFLERANLFLRALDDERQWYRYDRLFAQALRQQLRQTAPELVPVLQQRASCWYERQGLLAESAYYTQATAVPRSDALIESLTARESEVLKLLLDGASNREIARELVLSLNTVKKHVLNIHRKLNVQSRVQLITKARTLHLH